MISYFLVPWHRSSLIALDRRSGRVWTCSYELFDLGNYIRVGLQPANKIFSQVYPSQGVIRWRCAPQSETSSAWPSASGVFSAVQSSSMVWSLQEPACFESPHPLAYTTTDDSLSPCKASKQPSRLLLSIIYKPSRKHLH